MGLQSWKAQGITYPDVFPKSHVALAHVSSFLWMKNHKLCPSSEWQRGLVCKCVPTFLVSNLVKIGLPAATPTSNTVGEGHGGT